MLESSATHTGVVFRWFKYKYKHSLVSDIEVRIQVDISETYYSVKLKNVNLSIPAKNYNQSLNQKDIDNFVNEVGKYLYDRIE